MTNDMQQFWINQDGVQQGPMTIDQLRKLGVKPEAYVWCTGMPDWLPVAQVPEVAALIESTKYEVQSTKEQEPPVDHADAPASQPNTTPLGGDGGGSAPEMSAPMPELPQQPDVPMPQQYAAQQPMPQQPAPKMPPTNLGWAIGSMLLCCIPLGIVAIIYSNKVSTSYYNGDYAAAERYSETSAWWCIATIVLGIISQPFLSLLTM